MRKFVLIIVLIILTQIIDAKTLNNELNDILSLTGIQSGRYPEHNSSALKDFFRRQKKYLTNGTSCLVDDFGKLTEQNFEDNDINLVNRKRILDKYVIFRLYDKTDGNNSLDFLKVDDKGLLAKSRFNPNRPTVIITHGFTTNSSRLSVALIRDAYLEKYDYNVITVDWSEWSIGSYIVARLMVIPTGKHVGRMINFLYKYDMNSSTTTLIGHSLGAHLMGFAGQTAVPKVNHIIGLDPAGPLFSKLPADERISADDADYVEIIHTSGGFLGTQEILSDYDFFPNGGSFQLGCVAELFTLCSHLRAFRYLAKQIRGEGLNFYSVKCDSYEKFKQGKCSMNNITIMGAVNKMHTEKGKYYFDTNTEEPYALGFNCSYEYPIVGFLKDIKWYYYFMNYMISLRTVVHNLLKDIKNYLLTLL